MRPSAEERTDPFESSLEDADPELRAAVKERADPSACHPEPDGVGELRLGRCSRRKGSALDGKVRSTADRVSARGRAPAI